MTSPMGPGFFIFFQRNEYTPSGGGSFKGGRRKHKAKPVFYEPLLESLKVEPEIAPSDDLLLEIERLVQTEQLLEAQINLAKSELNILQLKSDLDSQIKAEITKQGIIEAANFMDQILLEMVSLRNEHKKRKEEEIVVSILMSQLGYKNITIH